MTVKYYSNGIITTATDNNGATCTGGSGAGLYDTNNYLIGIGIDPPATSGDKPIANFLDPSLFAATIDGLVVAANPHVNNPQYPEALCSRADGIGR